MREAPKKPEPKHTDIVALLDAMERHRPVVVAVKQLRKMLAERFQVGEVNSWEMGFYNDYHTKRWMGHGRTQYLRLRGEVLYTIRKEKMGLYKLYDCKVDNHGEAPSEPIAVAYEDFDLKKVATGELSLSYFLAGAQRSHATEAPPPTNSIEKRLRRLQGGKVK